MPGAIHKRPCSSQKSKRNLMTRCGKPSNRLKRVFRFQTNRRKARYTMRKTVTVCIVLIGFWYGLGSAQAQGDNPTQYQYMDVGTNIWASLRERGDDLQLEVRSDMSNLDMSASHDGDSGWLPPIVRQIKISGVTLLVTGKPIIIGSMDDPNSNREFQLEVTATNLR